MLNRISRAFTVALSLWMAGPALAAPQVIAPGPLPVGTTSNTVAAGNDSRIPTPDSTGNVPVLGPDGTVLAKLANVPKAVAIYNYLLLYPSLNGGASTIVCYGVAPTTCGYAALGKGSHQFVNGNGPQLTIGDPGGPAKNTPLIAPALTGMPVLIAVASGGDMNVPVGMLPTGTGGFMLRKADGTATGGNAGGSSAVDLQTCRTSAAQIASGAGSSLLGGCFNTIGGNYAGGGGQYTFATGAGSFAWGIAQQSSGNYSSLPGGAYGADRGASASPYASGSFDGNAGTAQTRTVVLRAAVTTTAVTYLTTDGNALGSLNSIPMANNDAVVLTCKLIARQAATPNAAEYSLDNALVTRGSSVATMAMSGTFAAGPTLGTALPNLTVALGNNTTWGEPTISVQAASVPTGGLRVVAKCFVDEDAG